MKRLQIEKELDTSDLISYKEENQNLIKRVEQLEKANSALLARNKVLEVMGQADL